MRAGAALLLVALLAGCGEQRRQLGQALKGRPPVEAGSLAGNWVLADLNGGGAPAGITLSFEGGDQERRVSGTGGCNRFTGRWTQDGEAVRLGPLAATRMACPPAIMDVEQRLLAALAAVTMLRSTPGGEALLSSPDGRKLTLRRAPGADE